MWKATVSVLLTVTSACASGGRGLDECPPLRMMTWNIAAGHGNLARTSETIRRTSADIVALQEVDVRWSERSAFVDQADSLAKLLGMSVKFAPIYSIPDTLRSTREFGVAILSRYPIVSWRNHEITRLSTQQQNAAPAKAPGFLEAVIDVRGTKVRAFSTHLDYRPDPSVRRTQVKEMLEVIRQSKVPTILAGDLNAPPTAPELDPLWILRDPISVRDGGAMTYPAQSPTKRIDYVLVSDDFTVSDINTEETDASDHRPVIMVMKPCRISR